MTRTDLDNAIASLSSSMTQLSSLLPKTAILSLGSGLSTAGSTLSLSCLFNHAGQSISGLQFDLWIPTSVTLASVAIGKAGSDAGKSVQMNPLGNGLYRILIFGLNQNLIGDGLLFTLTINIAPTAPKGWLGSGSQNALASDPNGNAVPLMVLSGGIQIG